MNVLFFKFEKYFRKKVLLLATSSLILFTQAFTNNCIAAPTVYYDEQSFLSSTTIVSTNDFENLRGVITFPTSNPFVDQGITYTAEHSFSVFLWNDESNGSYSDIGLFSNNVEKNTLSFGDNDYVESIGLSITVLDTPLFRSGQWVITLVDVNDNSFAHVLDWETNGASKYRGFSDSNGIKSLSIDFVTLAGSVNFSLDDVSYSEINTFPPVSEPITLTLDVSGGNLQECLSHEGNEVLLTANILGDESTLSTIQWSVDGNYVGDNNTIMPMLELGIHDIEVTVTTTTNEVATATASVEIKDTAAPVTYVSFLDTRSGGSVTQIDTANAQWIEASYESHDACDPNPVTEGNGGFPVVNGDLLKIKGSLGQIVLTAPVLELSVTSTDESGNTASDTATLEFVE